MTSEDDGHLPPEDHAVQAPVAREPPDTKKQPPGPHGCQAKSWRKGIRPGGPSACQHPLSFLVYSLGLQSAQKCLLHDGLYL